MAAGRSGDRRRRCHRDRRRRCHRDRRQQCRRAEAAAERLRHDTRSPRAARSMDWSRTMDCCFRTWTAGRRWACVALVLGVVPANADDWSHHGYCATRSCVGRVLPGTCFGYFRTAWLPWHAACGHATEPEIVPTAPAAATAPTAPAAPVAPTPPIPAPSLPAPRPVEPAQPEVKPMSASVSVRAAERTPVAMQLWRVPAAPTPQPTASLPTRAYRPAYGSAPAAPR